MADFRRWFTALAVLALMAGLASAQIGIAGSTTAGALSCTANGASIPQLRAEGYTELVGDILISCTGGPPIAPGSTTQIPTTNITVFMSPSTSAITSRLFASSGQTGLSEVVLLIDEPGSGLPTGVTGYGPLAPQSLCTVSTGCPAYVGSNSGYEVAVTSVGGSTAAQNMYQGYLNQVGSNTVTFYGVPVLPPVTSGVTRVFRITNIRFPVVGLGNQQQILASISTSPSTVLPLVQAGFPVGVVISPGLITSAKLNGALNPFAQCAPANVNLSSTLTFTEGFATSFKTRVVPMTNTQYAAEAVNTGTQNIPGGLYGGFASNSESGFIPGGTPADVSTTSTVYTAGLADFGTRLKAVFTNIPAGITLYVSTVSEGTAPVIGGQTLLNSYAVLVATGTGEATSDGTAFTPIAATVAAGVGGNALPAVPLAANSSGVATAVWEVTNAQPSKNESLVFDVYVSYAALPGSITPANPFGLPQITTILNAPFNNVSLSFAPEPSQGAFTAAAGPLPGTNIIPRFSILNPANFPFVSITLCQTTLLYPFVTANPAATGLGQGFDTGIAIANTSMDPFGTKPFPIANITSALNEIGSCTLYPYGVTLSSSGAQSAAPAVLKGCDLISNPVQGQNCFPVVSPGSVQTVLASTVFPGFQGYVIAICNFQYAHGYAAVTDLGLRGLFSSYLALELAPNSFGSAGRGVSIEQLVH